MKYNHRPYRRFGKTRAIERIQAMIRSQLMTPDQAYQGMGYHPSTTWFTSSEAEAIHWEATHARERRIKEMVRARLDWRLMEEEE